MEYQGLTLHEWIARGRNSGAIKDVLTVIWAYCIDEAEALRWVAAIANGKNPERDALATIKSDLKQHYLLAEIDWCSLLRPPGPSAT